MNGLKSIFAVGVVVAGLGAVDVLLQAQSDEASIRLEAAIQRQLRTGDVAAAVAEYEAILAKYGDQRRVAAQVLWRLAQGQEQLGRLEEARQSYERLMREHADQTSLATAANARVNSLVADEEWIERELNREVVVDASQLPMSTWETEFILGGRLMVFSDLSVFNPQTGLTHRLSTAARSAAYPVLSPNYREVAYLSWNGDLQQNVDRAQAGYARKRPAVELRVIGINGSDDRVLVRDDNLRWLRPYEWSPDGRFILALFERTSGVRQIALVGMDATVRVLKSRTWLTAQNMSFSPEGEFVAYQAATPPSNRQLDFYLLPVGSTGVPVGDRRITFSLAGQRGVRVTDTELATHVLNRIGFGPRRGDVDRVRTMGIDTYIAQQLYPERIADPVVDAKLAAFPAFKMDLPELLEKGGPPVAIAGRRRATIFERPGLVERGQAQAAAGPNRLTMAGADIRVVMAPDALVENEIAAMRLFRAVHSERQLNEVLVDFWMNHFNVNHDDHQLTPHFEEQAIRRHAFGRFEDLLFAVAKHPRMLFYLDNWRSSAPADVVNGRLADAMRSADVDQKVRLLERAPFLKDSKGLNENFGRELLELHTMGVEGGYTQADVIAVAKIMTGWTISSHGLVNGREEEGVFAFDPMMHVDGDKVVLGRTFKSGGVDEGDALLKMLARHPSTARFIATKLARRFIADEPPPAVIEAASRTFLQTDGDIRETLRAVLMSPQFRSSDVLRVKIKKPLELVASALRAVDATVESLDTYHDMVFGNRGPISQMGEKVYDHEAPDGNPDVGAAWMNSNALLLRLDFANRLATNKLQGVTINLAAAESVLTQLGVPRPTPQQIEQTRTMLQSAEAASGAAMGGNQMMMAGGAGAAGSATTIDPAAVAVAAMLGSPQFQKR